MATTICGVRVSWRNTFNARNLVLILCCATSVYLLANVLCSNNCNTETERHSFMGQMQAPHNTDTNQQGKPMENNADLPRTYLLIVIYSAPNDMRLRQTVRNTWLKLSAQGTDTWRYYFPIGTKGLTPDEIENLRIEQASHADLMLMNHLQEKYSQLSRKTLYVMQKVIQTNRFSFLLKVDIDSFVRVGILLKSLKDIEHPYLYWGFIDGRAPVHQSGKWMEKEWKLCDRYLPYAVGGGYVLSYQLVRFIGNNVQILKTYTSEDVSVGAWLAGLNTHYVHDPRFDTEWMSRGCSNEYLITHKQSEADMTSKFESISTTGNLCSMEYKKRGSYVYDWSVQPSKCCQRTNNTKIP